MNHHINNSKYHSDETGKEKNKEELNEEDPRG
jgi:hypothetical protein